MNSSRVSQVALVALVALALGAPMGVQAQEIELATYTPEQRWERAATLQSASWVSGIAYAKSLGKTAEDFAETISDVFAPGWGEPGSGSLEIVRGMHRNHSIWPNCEFELVEQSEESVTARVNRPWAGYFGDDEISEGVTLEEYEKTFQVFNSRLSEYLGLGYEEWVEDGWLYLKFTLGN
jgi:hypothetical protein